jgi:hypothetical protein
MKIMNAPSLSELIRKLAWRKRGYEQVFATNGPGHDAMVDLARFCRAYGGEVIINNHDVTLVLVGRREAFFRILDHLHFEPHDLVELYKATKRQEDE